MSRVFPAILATDAPVDGRAIDIESLSLSAIDAPGVGLFTVHVASNQERPPIGRVLRAWKGRLGDRRALFGDVEVDDQYAGAIDQGILRGLSVGAIGLKKDQEEEGTCRNMNLHHLTLTNTPKDPACRIPAEADEPDMSVLRRWAKADLARYMAGLVTGRPTPIEADSAEKVELVAACFLEHARSMTIGDREWKVRPPACAAHTLPWEPLSPGQAEEVRSWLSAEAMVALRAETMEAIAEAVRGMQRPASRPPAYLAEADDDSGYPVLSLCQS